MFNWSVNDCVNWGQDWELGRGPASGPSITPLCIDRKPVVSDNGGLDESYPSTRTYFVGLKESDGIKKWGGIEGVKNVRLVQYKLQ